MRQGKQEKTDYGQYRYWLLHDPNCTRKAMWCINERDFSATWGIHIRVHENPDAVDFSEPFGAILWHQRVNTGYPLCVASALMGLSMEDLIRLEMGWAVPEKEKLDGVLAAMSFYYGFDPLQFFRLIERGDRYREQQPVDLSEYLGLDLNEKTLALMPQTLEALKKSYEFIRTPIRVISKRLAPGIELPQTVVWSDGRGYSIDRIDSAQERAVFETGGIGTRFSCWFCGKHRYIGFENPGEWFAETPENA